MTSEERSELIRKIREPDRREHRRIRASTIAWLAFFLSLGNSLAVGYAVTANSHRAAENRQRGMETRRLALENRDLADELCSRVHKINVAGLRILDSPGNLAKAFQAGKISKRDYEQALAQIQRFDPLRLDNLRTWRAGDCRPSP